MALHKLKFNDIIVINYYFSNMTLNHYLLSSLLLTTGVIVYLINSAIPDIISPVFRNHIPDILWALALLLINQQILKSIRRALVLTMPIVIAFEVAQNFGIVAGTFDIADLVLEVGAISIYSTLKSKAV